MKILLFFKLPPPYTGATRMNKLIYESSLIETSFLINKLNVSYALSVADLGKHRIRKSLLFCQAYTKFIFAITVKRPKFIYFQPSLFGIAYLRDLLFIITGRVLGLKFLLHLHGKGIAEVAKNSSFKKRLYQLGFSNQYCIVLSNSQKIDITFTRPKKIFIVPNGIPNIIINDSILQNKISSDNFRFLFISNLFESKGVFDLIYSAKALLKTNKCFIIDIVGSEGDIKISELNKKIIENGLEKHLFVHGAMYNEDKNVFLMKANAFVYPTKSDLMPLVIIEAMQFGLPIISTNEGAIPELVIDGINGFVVDKDDFDTLVQKMAYLIDNPKIGKEFGKSGRSFFLKKYTIDHFEQNIKATIMDVLNIQKND